MFKSSGVRRFVRASSRAVAVVCLSNAVLLIPADEVRAQSVSVCYVPASGTLYLINQPGTPTKCHSSAHTELLLAASGPTGPQGATGPQGPAGPQGPQGVPGGLSGLEFNFASAPSLPPNPNAPNRGSFRATCSVPTKSVIHFGYEAGPGGPATIYWNRPAKLGDRLEWVFQATAGSAWQFYWTCADGLVPAP